MATSATTKPVSDSTPKFKFPKTMGACADRIYELKAKQSAAQKVVDAIEEERKALTEYIINTLPKSETTGVAGKFARVTVKTKTIPQVKDWEAFWKGFNKAKDNDLLQRRVSVEAVQLRWDAGKKVPGVEPFKTVTLSINKL